MSSLFKKFIRLESLSGLILIAATILAVVVENSALSEYYQHILELKAGITVGKVHIENSLLHWINDGLMALFFLLIGLELKREYFDGHLSDRKNIILPLGAAFGGMAVPAIIFVIINIFNPEKLAGWAIPCATDIAFALGLLSLLGKRVPASLKVFLSALAIFDDLGAIIVIAVFYTAKLSFAALLFALLMLAILIIMNLSNIKNIVPYLLIGLLLWVGMLESGVHATLGGFLLGITIPYRSSPERKSPLEYLEKNLHPWVAFLILPLFAFANSGINFSEVGFDFIFNTLTIGIIAGLFIGKQLGVYWTSWWLIKNKYCDMPEGATFKLIQGISILAGIGFTMSLFISSLAFKDPELLIKCRIGIVAASLIASIYGLYFISKAANEASKTLSPDPANTQA